MHDSPSYRLDIDGLKDQSAPSSRSDSFQGRPWVGIYFECCGVYARLYRNKEGTAYQGRCPRCMSQVKLTVGPGGTDNRFFTAQ